MGKDEVFWTFVAPELEEIGGVRWLNLEHRTQEREGGSKPTPPYFVFEQDTLLPESTGSTQEAVAPSRHD